MGLLLGDIMVSSAQPHYLTAHLCVFFFNTLTHSITCVQYDDRGDSVAQVYVALPQIRADRRKASCCPVTIHTSSRDLHENIESL